jgi:hypothetical protein
MFNNKALFEYIHATLADSGGDGGVSVVFKQQVASEVAKEYETWLLEKNLPFKRAELVTDDILFCSGEGENVTFSDWEEYGSFLRHEQSPPFIRSDFVGWDTVIVTW